MIATKIEIIFILRSKNGDFGRFERRLIRSTLGFFETLRLRFVRVFESSFRSQLCLQPHAWDFSTELGSRWRFENGRYAVFRRGIKTAQF